MVSFRKCRAFVGLLAASLFAPSIAAAQIASEPSFIDLGLEGQRQDIITVRNRGSEPAYLAIQLEEVLDPMHSTDETVVQKDPRAAGLLVSPQRMVLKPGSSKRVRLVMLETPTKDRFFKVKVVPQAGPVTAKNAVGVKVLVGYASWVFARPAQASAKLVGTRQGDTLTLRNLGNTHAKLRRPLNCPEAVMRPNEEVCEKLTPHRIYAGGSVQLELPHPNGPVYTFQHPQAESRLQF